MGESCQLPGIGATILPRVVRTTGGPIRAPSRPAGLNTTNRYGTLHHITIIIADGGARSFLDARELPTFELHAALPRPLLHAFRYRLPPSLLRAYPTRCVTLPI